MLFGTMVSGMTYAFETKEQRDEFFDAINDKHLYTLRDIETKKELPICGLCGKWCDCPYGHNPYPLLDNIDIDRRVCDKCNAEQVIPARRAGVFRTKYMDEDGKSEVLAECRKIITKQQDDLRKIAYGNSGEVFFPSKEMTETEPTLKAIFARMTECMDKIYSISNRMIDEAMIYAGQRLERHIKCRSISSPADICLTTQGVMAGLALHRDMEEYIDIQAKIANEFNEEVEAIRQKITTELIKSADIAPPKQEKVKTKAELKKEQTRNANKAKAEEKKAKEEQDRAIAQAQAQAEAQRKKKVREIAIKKQKAWLKEGERFLADLEKLNEEGA